jgi:hypothetical protein
MQNCKFCPFLRENLIYKVLELLPEKAQVGDRTGWKYKHDYQEGPNSIKVVEIQKQDDYEFKDEFYSDGVIPIGYSSAHNILKEAFRQCGITNVDINLLAPNK